MKFAIWPYGMMLFAIVALWFAAWHWVGLSLRGRPWDERRALDRFLEIDEPPNARRQFDLLTRLQLMQTLSQAEEAADDNEGGEK